MLVVCVQDSINEGSTWFYSARIAVQVRLLQRPKASKRRRRPTTGLFRRSRPPYYAPQQPSATPMFTVTAHAPAILHVVLQGLHADSKPSGLGRSATASPVTRHTSPLPYSVPIPSLPKLIHRYNSRGTTVPRLRSCSKINPKWTLQVCDAVGSRLGVCSPSRHTLPARHLLSFLSFRHTRSFPNALPLGTHDRTPNLPCPSQSEGNFSVSVVTGHTSAAASHAPGRARACASAASTRLLSCSTTLGSTPEYSARTVRRSWSADATAAAVLAAASGLNTDTSCVGAPN